MRLSKKAAIFLGLVMSFSALYFVYAYFALPPTREAHGLLGEIGGGLGGAAGWGLGMLYGRSLVKLLVNEGPWLQRFLPRDYAGLAQGLGQHLLKLLNRSHPPLGVLTIVLLVGHAGLASSDKANLFLILTMLVVFWQGGFGLFLKLRLTPMFLRKHSYLVHAQLITGGMILIFAGFGHLLVAG